jgi:hypothetical protein
LESGVSLESIDKVVAELNEARREAKADRAHSAVIAAVLGKAKVLGLVIDKQENITKPGFAEAKSMHDIGKRLLQSIGMSEPDALSIEAAIEENNKFIAGLERIRDQAQHTLEHSKRCFAPILRRAA